MVGSRPSLFPPPLSDRALLQIGSTAVEYEHRFDAMKEELVDPAEETEDVGVDENPTLLVTHGRLELQSIG